MKGLTTLLAIIAIICATSDLVAKNYFFYRLDGTPHSENPCESLVVVKFMGEKEGAELPALASRIPGLDDDYSPVEKARGFCWNGVDEGYGLNTVLQELRQDEEVAFA